METYWERRRNNRKDHSPLDSDGKSSRKELEVGDSFCYENDLTSNSTDIEKRPTKKNSQKENKKHPYKKTKK